MELGNRLLEPFDFVVVVKSLPLVKGQLVGFVSLWPGLRNRRLLAGMMEGLCQIDISHI